MKISDILRDLSLGELRNLAMSQETTGEIRLSDRDAIINYIKDGLDRIYTRFNLKQDDVLIEQVVGITNYKLVSRHAVNNPDPVDPDYPRYILDLPRSPFVDNVVKILAVYDGHRLELPLNDRGNPHSVYTPDPLTLQVPHPRDGEPLGIQYQALHDPIPLGVITTEVECPLVLYAALKSFVAHKVYMHIGTAETTAKSQEHYASFESVCADVEKVDGANSSESTTTHRFERNGWC